MTTRRLSKPASLESIVERVDQQRPGEITGDTIPTGFPSIDKLLGGGVRPRDLIVLGGDVGSGKSALALGIALRVAAQGQGGGGPVEGRIAIELRGGRMLHVVWHRSTGGVVCPTRCGRSELNPCH